MSSATAHGRKRNIRRRGRHKTPSQTEKAARLAVRAAPAVAVVGALAAFPQVRDIGSSTPASAAGHAVAADVMLSGTARSAATSDATSLRDDSSWSQHAKTAGARSAREAAARRAAAQRAAAQRAAAQRAAARRAAQAVAREAAARHRASPPIVGKHRAPVCSDSGGPLPENVEAIVDFLVAHGYTDNAAAGIAGNIYQESGGNPESGGSGAGGLIGWTPLPAGYITGSPSADLQTQLAGILSFNEALSQGLPALNAAASPAAAADIYVTDFEHASAPAAGTREASADAVAAACNI